MKYGESSFDILYLLFAVISGCVILGALICMLFYIPVAVAAGIVPMLMLPKTVCYILMICAFLKACRKDTV